MNKIKMAWFYPHELNLYGDRGNVEVIKKRCEWFGIDFELVEVTKLTNKNKYLDCNLVFMGGGPDSEQSLVYEDLIQNKKKFLTDYYNNGGVGLFICGAYQLLGRYYQLSDETKIDGLEVFDFYTKSMGVRDKRFVGNVVGNIVNPEISNLLEKNYEISSVIGFENHGGRTYFSKDYKPFLKLDIGNGNNGETKNEGLVSKGFICSYLHGPILHLNFHIADFLIASALSISVADLKQIDNKLELLLHKTNKNLFKR
jgi:lipid II isoglutaminyl synthase (glutamine-hydrolysing)